jgi:hypothetical protein
MPEEKPAPAYVGQEAPPPLPPIQVLTDPPPPKKKFPIPIWMIILIVVCFWLSLMATMYIYFIGKRDRDKQGEDVQTKLYQQAIVTIVITETPPPQKTVQTVVDNRRILTNNQFGYSIETPDSWKTEDVDRQFWTYEGTATNRSEPQPYNFARVVIEYPGKTKFKIVQWLDIMFPPEFGDKKAPVKKKLVTNKNGVEMLETQVNDPNGRLRYYFIANEEVVSLTFNTTDQDEVNKRFQPLYGQILDSVKLIPVSQPSEAKTQ